MDQQIAAQVIGLGGANDFSLWQLFLRADFVVKFNDINGEKQYNRSKKYYKDNLSYFDSKGYSHNDCRLTTGSIKLAQLVYDDKTQLLNKLSNYDNIQSTFIQ